jgi:nucleoid-associated protein YgaU
MKTLLALALFCGMMLPALAQNNVPPPPITKADELLTCDEAEARINLMKGDVDAAKKKLGSVKADIGKAESDLANAVNALKKCNDEIYALVGATEAEVNAYRQRVGQLEGKVREMQRMSDDALADRQDDIKGLRSTLNELARLQTAMIPEFYERLTGLNRDIKGLYREKRVKGYTVGTWAENRDCLWNIAGRTEIYADPFQWPKIWQANTDKIKNPDVIQPGWVLSVPPTGPKTSEEMKAERKYYRNKRAAQQAAESGAATSGTTK